VSTINMSLLVNRTEEVVRQALGYGVHNAEPGDALERVHEAAQAVIEKACDPQDTIRLLTDEVTANVMRRIGALKAEDDV
jgi:hypothetical protein